MEHTNGVCKDEHLQIRDGMSSTSPSLGVFCNENRSIDLTSNSNSLFIEMKTDCKDSDKGFRAFWRIAGNG